MYPLYASVEALRTRREQELLQWITFWWGLEKFTFSVLKFFIDDVLLLVQRKTRTVNALFWVVETVGDTIISWVPFYLEAKIVALAWLVLPSYRGALLLHQKWLAPAFQQHEEVIDFTIADLKRRAGEKMVQVCKDTAVIALRNSSDVVAQSQQLGKLQPADTAPKGRAAPGVTADRRDYCSDECGEDNLVAESKQDASVARSEEMDAKISKKQAKEGNTASSRTEKAKQVLDHFKKLMVKGFQLKYHPSVGVVKHRALLLEASNARYVSFMSARDAGSIDSKKKAARLLLHNLRRVSASAAEECALFAKMVEEEEVDASVAFVLDNGKAVMLFEAESQKSRDLLVAGLRLLITEHKRRDTGALNKLCWL
ncbi:PH domain-like [Phytophthora cactorum]|nr:PH domain-like [Phytophthora cactorum]